MTVVGVGLEHSLVLSELMSKVNSLRVGIDSTRQSGTLIYIFSYIYARISIHG